MSFEKTLLKGAANNFARGRREGLGPLWNKHVCSTKRNLQNVALLRSYNIYKVDSLNFHEIVVAVMESKVETRS